MTTDEENAMQPTAKERKTKRLHQLRNGGIILIVIVACALLIGVGYSQNWKFFTEATTTSIETNGIQTTSTTQIYHRTMWDWLQLLIIPVVLAGAVFLLNRSERRNELVITEQRLQEEALQSYLDKMTELLLNKRLRLSADDEERAVARTRTLTVLRRLDEVRKGIVIRFLHESGLIQSPEGIVSLLGADVRRASLRGAYLKGADLRGIDLSRADLREAFLIEARISGAHLNESRLSGAYLNEANLSASILSGADLRRAILKRATMVGTILSGANLTEANLEGANLELSVVLSEQLARVKSLKGAIMPDGTKHE